MGLPKEQEPSAASSAALAGAQPGPSPAFEVLSGLEIIQQFFFLPVRSPSEEQGGEDFWMEVLGTAGEHLAPAQQH